MRAGDYPFCLERLAGLRLASPAIVEFACRLAEALFHAGRAVDALACGRRVFDAAGPDRHILDFCAWLFSNCGAHDLAAAAYERMLEARPDWIEGHRHISGSFAAVGLLDRAVAHAVTATRLAPHSGEFAAHAAELLLRAGRIAEAAALAGDAARVVGDDPVLWRVLSAAEMLAGRVDAALLAVDAAIALAPDNAEYRLHRAHLAFRNGDRAAAAAACREAAALDPGNPAVKRLQLELLLTAGRVTEATALAGTLLAQHPEDTPSAEAARHVLNQRLDAIDGDYIVLRDEAAQFERPVRETPGLVDRLRTQMRVIHALMIRETRTRFGDSKLGYGWALIEPIAHIALLSAVFAWLMKGQPPIGGEFFIFYYTGVIPYHIFVHTSSAMTHAVTSNGALLQLPLVTTFDVIAARGLLETVTDVVVALLLLAGFAAVGFTARPDDIAASAAALLLAAALGCGCGFINAVATGFCRSWDKIWAQVTRALYFCSGIFYMPDTRGILRLSSIPGSS